MAVIYLRSSDGSDSDDGSTWALAKATLQAAITAAGNGGTVYVAKGFTENRAGDAAHTTITLPSTLANAVTVIAVDDTGNPEPPTTVVTKDDTTHPKIGFGGGSYDYTFDGFAYFYGIEWWFDNNGGSDAVNSQLQGTSTGTGIVFEECALIVTATGSSGGRIASPGTSNNSAQRWWTLRNCKYAGHNAQHVFDAGAGSSVFVEGGALTSASSSSGQVLISAEGNSDVSTRFHIRGSDVSQLGSTANLTLISSTSQADAKFERCKVSASLGGWFETQLGQHRGRPYCHIHSVASADQYYAFAEGWREGIVEEDTSIYRSGGATYDGTNGFSLLYTTGILTTCERVHPLRVKLATLVVDMTSAKTLTVEICQNGGAVIQDEEFWIEVEYPSAANTTLGVHVDTRPGPLTAAADLSTSSETWTGAGGGASKQYVSYTLPSQTSATAQIVTVWGCLARSNTTLYVCPQVEVT